MFKLSTTLVLLSVSQLSSLTVVKLMVLNGNNSLTTQTLLESHLLHQANSPSRTPISSVNSKQLAETLLFLLLYLPILLQFTTHSQPKNSDITYTQLLTHPHTGNKEISELPFKTSLLLVSKERHGLVLLNILLTHTQNSLVLPTTFSDLDSLVLLSMIADQLIMVVLLMVVQLTVVLLMVVLSQLQVVMLLCHQLMPTLVQEDSSEHLQSK